MIKKPITIQIANGLEARPVALLVQVASQYEAISMWNVRKNGSMQRALWV